MLIVVFAVHYSFANICNCFRSFQVCSKNIESKYKERYDQLFQEAWRKKKGRVAAKASASENQDRQVNDLKEKFQTRRNLKKAPPAVSVDGMSVANMSDLTGSSTPEQSKNQSDQFRSYFSKQATVPLAKRYLQGKLDQPNKRAKQLQLVDYQVKEQDLTAAIAHWIHSKGLNFSISSCPLFHDVIKRATEVTVNYKPPSRNLVAGLLLTDNYECQQKQNIGKSDW